MDTKLKESEFVDWQREIKAQHKKDYIFKILFIIFLIGIVVFLSKGSKQEENIEMVRNLTNISEPIQRQANGSTTVMIDGKEILLTYLATYEISGLVVKTDSYYGKDIYSQLAPKDVSMVWGFLLKEENLSKIHFSRIVDRFIMYNIKDSKWLESVGGMKKVSECISNNHLIPSDKNVEKLIKKIKQNEYVKIEGYLVSAKEIDGKFKATSSQSRTDDGNGACELIYVTNVTWLAEE